MKKIISVLLAFIVITMTMFNTTLAEDASYIEVNEYKKQIRAAFQAIGYGQVQFDDTLLNHATSIKKEVLEHDLDEIKQIRQHDKDSALKSSEGILRKGMPFTDYATASRRVTSSVVPGFATIYGSMKVRGDAQYPKILSVSIVSAKVKGVASNLSSWSVTNKTTAISNNGRSAVGLVDFSLKFENTYPAPLGRLQDWKSPTLSIYYNV